MSSEYSLKEYEEKKRLEGEQPNVFKCNEVVELKNSSGGPWYESFLLRNGEPL